MLSWRTLDRVRELGNSVGYRLLVRSIGAADASVLGVLRGLRACSDAELAAMLYRAPSEILSGLTETAGNELRDALRKTGVELELVPANVGYEPGKAECEVALVITSFSNMLQVIDITARVLGVDLERAKKLVCATPAVLLGQISSATVEALRHRYAEVGVTLDCSVSSAALFDLVAESMEPTAKHLIVRVLRELGHEPEIAPAGQLIVSKLNALEASRVWNEAAKAAIKVQLLNHDFQRLDVRLESGPHDGALLAYLSSCVGMSEVQAERALRRAPFLLKENVTRHEATEMLRELTELGATATAIVLAQRRYGLKISPGGERQAAQAWVDMIVGRSAATGFESGSPIHLPGPFTKTQARWLQFELRKHQIQSHLVER